MKNPKMVEIQAILVVVVVMLTPFSLGLPYKIRIGAIFTGMTYIAMVARFGPKFGFLPSNLTFLE